MQRDNENRTYVGDPKYTQYLSTETKSAEPGAGDGLGKAVPLLKGSI
jgi:hypothetical protein